MAKAEAEGKRVFQVAAYEADGEGVLRPVLPRRCAFSQGAGGCHLYIDHYRARKTGPRFPLAVVGCRSIRTGATRSIPPDRCPTGEAVAP